MSDFVLPAFPRMRSGYSRVGAYVGLAAAYLVVYLALNFLTDHRSLSGTSITLWSPDDAMSVLLIMESWTFAPVLWLAQIAVDLAFSHVRQSFLADIVAQTTLAAGFCGLAYTLRASFGLNVRALRPRDLLALMAVVPIGVALVGLAFCGALLLVGDLAPADFVGSFAGFWIGDAAAMCVLIPAAGALFRVILVAGWQSKHTGNALFVFAITLVFAALVVLVSTSSVESRYVFNLLYLPILLIGMKYGFDAGALALLLVQILLLAGLDLFHVSDREFSAYQMMMFILAISGQALGGHVHRVGGGDQSDAPATGGTRQSLGARQQRDDGGGDEPRDQPAARLDSRLCLRRAAVAGDGAGRGQGAGGAEKGGRGSRARARHRRAVARLRRQ